MSRRVTPKGTGRDPDALPSLRERNPFAWWVAIITVAGLVIGSFASGLIVLLA